ncbi:MAG: lysophospholipase [Chlorobi bacterium]|nr:lysophospholipase [Chlorobiota bacterium]MCI0717136.1 lysophospholipase [Chlorobiota bacterium]
MKTVKLSIHNKKDLKLAANLDLPDGNVKTYAIYAHCFTCSKDLKAIININRSLTKMGIASLRFDMTGIGESEGDFSETNFSTQIEDFHSAADFLSKNYKAAKLLIGHSLGGCVAIYASLKLPYVKAISVISTPSEPSSLSRKLKNTKNRAIQNGFSITEIGGVKFKFKPQFFYDIESYSLKEELKKLKRPFLIMHSPTDTYNDISNAAELFKNAKHPKSFISLDGMDHLMLKKEDAFYVGNLIGIWAEKYL